VQNQFLRNVRSSESVRMLPSMSSFVCYLISINLMLSMLYVRALCRFVVDYYTKWRSERRKLPDQAHPDCQSFFEVVVPIPTRFISSSTLSQSKRSCPKRTHQRNHHPPPNRRHDTFSSSRIRSVRRHRAARPRGRATHT